MICKNDCHQFPRVLVPAAALTERERTITLGMSFRLTCRAIFGRKRFPAGDFTENHVARKEGAKKEGDGLICTRRLLAVFLLFLIPSCVTVIRKDLMEEAKRIPDIALLAQDPDGYRGDLFVLGGTVV